MSVRNDAERFGIEILGRFGTNTFSVVSIWVFAVADIIVGLRPQMSAQQFALCMKIFERWGMAVPDSLNSGPPKIWMRSEVSELKKFFADTLPVIRDVRDAYRSFPHAFAGKERDMARIAECERFCESTLAEIDRLVEMGDIFCEGFVFRNLIYHCKELMGIVMGEEILRQFVDEYDTAMRSLRRAHDLVNAPEI